MEGILEAVKSSLGTKHCSIVSLPEGGIVNAGKAAVIQTDDRLYFMKHNDTEFVSVKHSLL